MLNFTVGPVQMDKETRKIGKKQIPYFRTPEFSTIMKDNEKLLCDFFDAPAQSRVAFITGSGTAALEATIINFFTKNDNILIVNGGSFGQRLVELCEIFEIHFTEIKLEYGTPLTKEVLYEYDSKNYSGMFLQLCETSTGVLYDMELVGDFCKKNNIFLCVDAISGFLADFFSMKKFNVNVAITGSQKALALPPSMSFIVIDSLGIEKCCKNKVKSMYFNLADYLKNGERGQTPFTPAVGTLLMLNEKLNRLNKVGGALAENMKIQKRASYFRKSISDLPLKLFTPESSSSNCVTTLTTTNGQSAYDIFIKIKDEHKTWICPNGGELKDKVFRVGHIGHITKKEMDKLIKILHKICK